MIPSPAHRILCWRCEFYDSGFEGGGLGEGGEGNGSREEVMHDPIPCS